MNELTIYIDNYFNNQLSSDEMLVFEKRCETDEQFADEVALYIASREAIRNNLLAQKRQEWKNLATAKVKEEKKRSAKIVNIKKWYWLAAAASVLVIFFIALPAKKSPQQLAGNYIDKNLTELSVLMSNAKDSLQNGIQAYNRKDYNNALAIFKNLYNNDSANADALKYEGLAYLMLIDYDNAIGSFHTLSTKTGMFSNPGLFYKALTLLKRNSAGDIDEGRKLLRNVVENKLEGETEAEKLLEKL